MRGLPTRQLNDDYGLNWNDYGARFYDAAIGRFPTIDPLAETTPYWSLYVYVGNDPITFTDPTGMARDQWHGESEKIKDERAKIGQPRDGYNLDNSHNIASQGGSSGKSSDVYLDKDGNELKTIHNNDPEHFYQAEKTARGTINVTKDLGSTRPMSNESTSKFVDIANSVRDYRSDDEITAYNKANPRLMAQGGLNSVGIGDDPIFALFTFGGTKAVAAGLGKLSVLG